MNKSESVIMKEIQIALANAGVLLFRNNTGAYKTESGAYVRYGLGERGGSDLIGIMPLTINGKNVGVFVAIEVKSSRGKATEQQLKFIKAIQKQGGIAGIARSVGDALGIINDYKERLENGSN